MFKKFLILNILCYSLFSCSDNKKELPVDNNIKLKSVTKPTFQDDTLVSDSIQDQEFNTEIKKSLDMLRKLPEGRKIVPIVSRTKNRDSLKTEKTTPPIIPVEKDSIKKLCLTKRLTNLDIPPHGNLNTRQWIILFYKTFKEGDYISGTEMAAYYQTTTHLNHMAKSSIIHFLDNHIGRITKKNNQLVFTTIPKEGVINSVHIPLIVDLFYEVDNGASITFHETFVSHEKEFKNWPMLPIDISGVTVLQKKDTIPNHGYLNNNAYFIDYPSSKLNYKIHK